jgi:hypothetical protein
VDVGGLSSTKNNKTQKLLSPKIPSADWLDFGWLNFWAVHEHGHQRKRINNVWSAIEISELGGSHSAEHWCCVDHA